MSVRILVGDCRERMKKLPDASVDSVVCDPPYHLTSIVKRFGKPNSAPINNRDEKEGRNGPYHRASKGFMGPSTALSLTLTALLLRTAVKLSRL